MNFEFNNRSDTWSSRGIGDRNQKDYNRCLNKNIRNKTMAGAVSALGAAIVICLFGFFVFGESSDVGPTNIKTLKFAAILFRHGARTPTSTYNSDPYKNYNWPDGWGALTNVGKMQLYEKGKKIRQQYSGFLPDEYWDDDVHVQSSDSSRTLMSASTLLAGLYPPVERQKWNPAINWQPIPIHSNARDHDYVIVNGRKCPYFDKLYAEAKVSPYVKDLDTKYKDLYDKLTLHCNQTMQDILSVEFLYSTLKIEEENGLVLPEWTKDVYPGHMEDIYRRSLALFTYDTIMKRLRGGPLLNEIINTMEKIQNNELKRKLSLYSAHDLTIVTLWRTIGFETFISPDYGSSLVFELHSIPNSSELEVKLLYYSSWEAKVSEAKIPGCDAPCKISQFKKVTENVIPKDWNAECQLPE